MTSDGYVTSRAIYSSEFPRPCDYEEIGRIGNGAYGTVFKARDLRNEGQMVALKKIRVRLSDEGVPMSTLREIATLKQLEQFQHPNIVRLLDICYGRRSEADGHQVLMLVFEHIDQDLSAFMEHSSASTLSPDVTRSIMYQLLSGVDFLHNNRIVHRDLKPQNILVDSQCRVKITDFGLSRVYDYQMTLTNVVVTLWYRAPEVLLQSSYASQVDIWSAGCIFAELWRRAPLFCGNSEAGQLVTILDIMGTPDKNDWPEHVAVAWSAFHYRTGICLNTLIPDIDDQGIDLLKRMLTFNSASRISASEALCHAYFDDEQLRLDTSNSSNVSQHYSLTPSSANDSSASHDSI